MRPTTTATLSPATALDAPTRFAALDLEALAELDLPPEYVLAFLPPHLCARIRDRLTCQGWWDLLTLADYSAGNPPRDGWVFHAPRSTPHIQLADWVTARLGHPVRLQADTYALKAEGMFSRWHTAPLYWVTRDT